ncbi:MAG: bile acid:sodium symporter family protein [Bryobacteraceae bacterium]
MNLASLITLALKLSVMLIVFSLGLGVSATDVLYLRRRPGLLIRSLLSIDLAMPLVAAAMATIFHLRPPVEIALVALAIAPVPPLLPRKGLKAGGHAPYMFSLLVAAAVFAIVFIPIAVLLIGRTSGLNVRQSAASIAELVFLTVLLPLSAGILMKLFAPILGKRALKPVSVAGSVLLLVSLIPTLFTQAAAMFSLIGNGTLAAIIGFIVAGLFIGHVIGGPEPENRTTLALFTAARHPGIAVAIAATNFPQQKLVLPTVLLYLLINAIVSSAYLSWRRNAESKKTSNLVNAST